MRLIPLTQGKFARVDDADYESLSKYKWFAQLHRKTWYAIRNEGTYPFRTTVKMHKQIMHTPPKMETDHRDGDGLNNQRENLRVSTNAQNRNNTERRANNVSGYKGVYFNKQRELWMAQIQHEGKKHNLGYYETPEGAAHAYDDAARKYHGDFAKPNFP